MPRLRADPAERRKPIGTLVERRERPFGSERPADALDHDLKSALSEQAPEQQPDRPVAAVRRADQHGRLRAATIIAPEPAVGEQHRAVVHRDAQVALADDVERLGRDQPHAPGEQLAGKAHGGSG